MPKTKNLFFAVISSLVCLFFVQIAARKSKQEARVEKQPSSTWGRGGKFPQLPAGSRRAGDAGGGLFPFQTPARAGKSPALGYGAQSEGEAAAAFPRCQGLSDHRQEIVGFAAQTQPKSAASSPHFVRFRFDVTRGEAGEGSCSKR